MKKKDIYMKMINEMRYDTLKLCKDFVFNEFEIITKSDFKEYNDFIIYSDNRSVYTFLEKNKMINKKNIKNIKNLAKYFNFIIDNDTFEILYVSESRNDFTKRILNFMLNILNNKIK